MKSAFPGVVLTFWVAAHAALLQAQGAISPPTEARVRTVAQWLRPYPQGPGIPATNRAAWAALATNAAFHGVVAQAEALARQPIPDLPDELYLDYSKTGNRTRCQEVMNAREKRLRQLVLAECLEDQGRFLAPLTGTIEALCRERTWVLPAHDGRLENFQGRAQTPDLRATRVAWDLATCDFLLGTRLAPQTRSLIRENVGQRVTGPFREMVEGRRPAAFWLTATHNWNAVCLCGVTGAALALEDSPVDRAFYVAAAEKLIRSFLAGFTPDGYCSEGIGYWNYGFGHFLLLGETVRRATGGKLDFLTDPAAYAPARFGFRSEIRNGIYPTIADCPPGSRPAPQWLRYIGQRFGQMPVSGGTDQELDGSATLAETALLVTAREALPRIPEAARAAESPLRTWFADGGVLICRPAPEAAPSALAVVLKGGNNNEHHNHNDLGTFAVVSGKSMLVCDPGNEVYTARTFSAHRYDSRVLSSYGHPVPVVGGRLQSPGAVAQARVVRSAFSPESDALALDLRSAYELRSLRKLERSFHYARSGLGTLKVTDTVEFAKPETFESALITWGEWTQTGPNELLLVENGDRLRVRIDTAGQPFTIRAEVIQEDLPGHRKPTRIAIALDKPVAKAAVSLTLEPAPKSTQPGPH